MGETGFGLTLANRGVTFGATTVEQMLDMAQMAEESGLYQSVWVGDSLLGKPRMESIALLGGVAARTKRVRIGPACMASFPLRDPVLLAYQWASLDLLSAGRTVLVVCTGIGKLEGHQDEARLYGVTNKDRVERMLEGIDILKRLWTEESVTYQGKHFQFENISIAPKPVAQPRPPIWIANNAQGDATLVDRTLRRVAEYADGWQMAIVTAPVFAERWQRICEHARDLGRDPDQMGNVVYHNININEDRDKAREESKRFLDTYYATDWPADVIERWVSYGSPEDCIAKLRTYVDIGAKEVTLRISAWDQMGQLKRCIEEVRPHLTAKVTLAGRAGA
jgi:alkanesulfonate monooxygenase SsuD/methylene tetrahydromethanopterin reductase-like flavin-dependent oxidoreductase (luciferase family)